jgi:hypothetical protein
MYRASGWGGQRIIVLPEVDTVVVFPDGKYATTPRDWKILRKHILPAVH